MHACYVVCSLSAGWLACLLLAAWTTVPALAGLFSRRGCMLLFSMFSVFSMCCFAYAALLSHACLLSSASACWLVCACRCCIVVACCCLWACCVHLCLYRGLLLFAVLVVLRLSGCFQVVYTLFSLGSLTLACWLVGWLACCPHAVHMMTLVAQPDKRSQGLCRPQYGCQCQLVTRCV